ESWGLEPALHRLAAELEDQLVVEPVMAGLAREFGPALTQVGAWLDVAESSGMPVDPRLWLASPPASSYPSCMAVKAAAEQGAALEAAYLRRLREGFACGRRKVDTRDSPGSGACAPNAGSRASSGRPCDQATGPTSRRTVVRARAARPRSALPPPVRSPRRRDGTAPGAPPHRRRGPPARRSRTRSPC